jgi:hypothetical protein
MKRLHPVKILLTLALFALGSCKTEDVFDKLFPPLSSNQLDRLPPETQAGQRTFGCLVNGQAWTPAGSQFGGPLLSAEVYGNRLGISCHRAYGGSHDTPAANQSMGFSIDSVTGPGTYRLDKSTKNVFHFSDYLTNCEYLTGNGLVATVQLTRFDLVARVAAGRFSFTLETPGCGSIVVTDGRFDCPF